MPNYKVAVTLCVLLLFTLILRGSVSAQSEKMEKKMEVGAQISALAGRIGGGGRVTYNVNNFFALEGELNYLSTSSFNNRREFQGQFGVKSGLRFKKFGIFGKVRPGFVNAKQDIFFSFPTPCVPARGTVCVQSILPISFSDSYTGFSLDVGGVAELYPSKRIVLRLDVGDTIVNRRFPSIIGLPPVFVGEFPPDLSSIQAAVGAVRIQGSRVTTHNSQLSVGVGFRF